MEKYNDTLIKFNSKKDNHIFEETFKKSILTFIKADKFKFVDFFIS
ncbi:hypothetical protein bcere0026_26480 [Bacillus mycoides]|uniref:Uncharacterized protein n=1 Tax=Bacillus mycoides TaxID=1405 RepID=C2XVC4_BACMY|nr:hypothetical protein bcere0026_26480 [Bacillus mycoides]